MAYFEKVKKNFGFGCMRLPMKGDEVDYEEISKMVDILKRRRISGHFLKVSLKPAAWIILISI